MWKWICLVVSIPLVYAAALLTIERLPLIFGLGILFTVPIMALIAVVWAFAPVRIRKD